MPDDLIQQIEWLARRMADARRVVCMTGAGVSAESGVPTFRDAGGLWEGQRPEDVATPQAFARDHAMVWRFYLARRRGLLSVKPNPAHYALVELERACPCFDLITQNVDGLHHLAGSSNVICLHGDIQIDRCTRCGFETRVTAVGEAIPKCEQCGSLARPGVVWFGEMLPPEAFEKAARCAEDADLMLVVGTSSVVQPAASLAEWAKSAGATVAEINLNRTPLSRLADVTLLGRAGEIMPRLVEAFHRLRAE
jgi:NAD-dependent deacetylase